MILINPGSPNRHGNVPHTVLPFGANLRGMRTDDVLISLDELVEFIQGKGDGREVLEYIMYNLAPTLRPTRKEK